MWQDLYQRLVSPTGYGIKYPPLDEIDSSLRSCESPLGIDLPASYCNFIHTFGPGELCGWFRIYGPHIKSVRKSPELDILRENESWRDPEGFWATTADPKLVERAVFFCDTGGGDAFYWDPSDMTDVKRHEFGIYELPHSAAGLKGQANRVATSFVDFIRDYCLTTMWPKLVYEDDQTQEYWSTWPTKRLRQNFDE